MIKLNHVSFSYQNGEANEMQVLSDVSFQASRGECVVLCGKSGCGKTTMLRLVNGLIPHFYTGKLEGNVLVGGQEMQQTPLSQTSRIVGSVFPVPSFSIWIRPERWLLIWKIRMSPARR